VTTVGFRSKQLLDEQRILKLASFSNNDAIEMGQIALNLGSQRKLLITIEIRIGDRVVFQTSL
jgi:uncharacterized protein (UPF0303 family)